MFRLAEEIVIVRNFKTALAKRERIGAVNSGCLVGLAQTVPHLFFGIAGIRIQVTFANVICTLAAFYALGLYKFLHFIDVTHDAHIAIHAAFVDILDDIVICFTPVNGYICVIINSSRQMHKCRNRLGGIFLTNAHDQAFLGACSHGGNKVTCQIRFAVSIDKIPFHVEVIATCGFRIVRHLVTIGINVSVLRKSKKPHA